MTIHLEPSWKKALQAEFEKPYMKTLKSFLTREIEQGKTIYPQGQDIFSALNLTPLEKVKVVIIGQDPYHGPGQAHGLSFSVKPGTAIPPSLQNIYKELHSDLGLKIPTHGYLSSWAQQGVLLLNAVLTVERGKPASHQNQGWEQFTDQIIKVTAEQRSHLVYLLWGKYAQQKGAVIDRKQHLVLTATHPSPFSAHRGFLGSQHFSKTNAYLQSHGDSPVDWQIQ